MSLAEAGITYKKTDEMRVARINFRGESKDKDLASQFEKLYQACKEYVCGPAIAVYDYGVYTEGIDIEVCFPVNRAVAKNEVTTRILESVDVLSIIRKGPYDSLRESYRKLYRYLEEHGVAGTALAREVYLNYDVKDPEANVTELQAVLHKWEERFVKNVERVLGKNASKPFSACPALESTIDERVQWLKIAVEELDSLANDSQKYDILSRCAHDFSEKRIGELRAVYERTKDIDEVLKAMYEDPLWYEDPVQKGDTIYMVKVPCNPEGCQKATTEAEKKMNYCHCPMVRTFLDRGISPTFCTCGSGWYRQIWEGILGKPVRVEMVRSLLRGDDVCEFAIHL